MFISLTPLLPVQQALYDIRETTETLRLNGTAGHYGTILGAAQVISIKIV
jgi:hypothetical protein